MKLFKNIVQILALVSLSLSVTPLTTAKAATNTPIQVTKEDTKATATSLGITTTPVAEAASTDTTGDTTTTNAGDPASSNVSVTVLSGILTLEAVPDFNFGAMMQGTIAPLKTNTVDTSGFNTDGSTSATAAKDGNDAGLLEVIDSRNDMKTMPGFTLSASISKLNPSTANAKDASLRAILHLSAMPLLNGDNDNVSTSSKDLTTEKTSIDSGETGNENTMPVMALEAGSYNGGVIKANFNTSDSASLELPDSGTASTEASAKKMNSIVTWTLSTKPVVK